MAEGTFLLAEQLGVETVVMMSGLPGGCPEDRTPHLDRHVLAAGDGGNPPLPVEGGRPGVEGAGRPARDHGVKRIALEFHGWQLVYNVETLRRLRSEVGRRHSGGESGPQPSLLDGGGPRGGGPRPGGLHLPCPHQGRAPGAGCRAEHPAGHQGRAGVRQPLLELRHPGTGHDAAWWRRFLETLQDCGYDGALSIEQEDYTIPLEEALQKAVSLLRQALPA